MMSSRKTVHSGDDGPQPNFWTSYSDLMAGMLLVFVLLLVIALFHFSEFNRQRQALIKVQEQKLVAFHYLQNRLIGQLKNAFEKEAVSIDSQTGVLQIESGILFGEGQATLSEEGRNRLSRLFETYIQVVLAPEFRGFVKQIEIEGHTNSRGSYLHNLELSQQRALIVMKELLQQEGQEKQLLKELVVAGGRSFSHLVRDAQGREDPVKSRRIEVKFRLKESEMFQDIYRQLSE